MRKIALLCLALLLLTGCGHTAPPAETVDPYAGMVQVESGYGTRIWVREHEELEQNPLREPEAYAAGAELGYELLSGLDVSEHQGEIDWAAVREAGMRFAIVRAGYRGYGQAGRLREDAYFARNMSAAAAQGLELGVYFFSQAVTPEEAVEEAEFLLELLAQLPEGTVGLPVFYDWEDIDGLEARTAGLDGETVTRCAQAFCETVTAAGYQAGIYAYRSLAYFTYDLPRLRDYTLWIGALNTYPDFYFAHEFWQRAVETGVPGVRGDVDMDIWLRKLPDAEIEEE